MLKQTKQRIVFGKLSNTQFLCTLIFYSQGMREDITKESKLQKFINIDLGTFEP